MVAINSNQAAAQTASALYRNDRIIDGIIERLSTGKRINSAADDPAGLAISTRLTSQVNGLNQAARNANNAISMIQIADNSADTITNIFQRMREIVVQAADGSNSASDVALLNTEFKALAQETDRLVDTTSYNGKKLLNGDAGGVAGSGDSTVTFQIGANATQTLKVDFADFGLAAGGAGTTTSTWEGSDARVESLRQLGAGESLAFIGTQDDGSAFTLTIDATKMNAQTTRSDGFATVTLAEVVDALNYEFMANDAGLGDDGTTTLSAGISDSGQLVFTDAESDDVDRVGGTVDSVSSPTTGAQTLSQSGANPMRTDLSVYKDVGMGGSYNTTLEQLDKAIEGIASQRATFGASMNRLEYAVDNLHSSSLATSVARGRIEDTNYAAETARLAKQQILEQVGTALLAQANIDAKSVLKLLSAN